jgi:hypothetical protein
VRGRSGEEAEGGLCCGVDARPGSSTVLTCCDQVVARRPLQGEAGAGEGVSRSVLHWHICHIPL